MVEIIVEGILKGVAIRDCYTHFPGRIQEAKSRNKAFKRIFMIGNSVLTISSD